MMQMSLDHADRFLRRETPKEFTQQLAASSEALRRARTRGGGGGLPELEELRNLLEPLNAKLGGAGGTPQPPQH